MSIIIVATDTTRVEEITYSEITFNKRKAQKSVRAFISVQSFFLWSVETNVCAEYKKVKAFIKSLRTEMMVTLHINK